MESERPSYALAAPPWPEILLVALMGLLLYLPGIGPERGLWNPDEPRFGEIAREMAARGELATPILNGEPYSNKPPLLFWSIVGASALTDGVNERAARLPSTFAAAALLAVTFALAWRVGGRHVAWLSALVLGTGFRFMWQAGWVQADMLLALFVMISIAGYTRAARLGRVDGASFAALYLGAALATLTKGLPGIVLPGLIAFVDVARRRAWRELPRYRIPSGVALVVAIVGPWLVTMHGMHGPEFLDNLIIKQHFERYVDAFDHRSGPAFYFVSFAWQFLPWSLLVPATGLMLVKDPALRKQLAFPLLSFASVFLFFTLSTSKRGQYLLPVFPLAAIVLGTVLDRFLRDRMATPDDRWISAPLRLGQAVTLLVVVLTPLGFLATLGVLRAMHHPLANRGFADLVPMATMASLVLLPVLAAVVALGRRSKPGLVLGTALLITAIHLDLRCIVLPAIDSRKSARPFVEAVVQALPPNTHLGAYRFWRGYLNFYLEREQMPVYWDPAEALRHLDSPGPGCLIARTKYLPELEELGGASFERVLTDWIGSKELTLICSPP